MQKNIFNVLAVEDSDDESKKVTKKVQRQQEKTLRENVGDKVEKPGRNDFEKKHQQHHKTRGGKREFDRQSGTGRKAFGNRKEGGFGKGNEAQGNPVNNVEGVIEEIQEENQVKEEAPKLKTVDDYFQGKNNKFVVEQTEETQKVSRKGKANLLDKIEVTQDRRRGQQQKKKFVDLRDKEEFPALSQLI